MAPPDGALIPGITKYVSDAEDIEKVVNDMAEQGVNAVSLAQTRVAR